jgi:acyl-lipid omega-6 desaturase (Delta-12 desaturase)
MNLSDVRKKIDPLAYRHSLTPVLFWCSFDLLFYLASMYGVFFVKNIGLKLLLGISAGIAASGMFVLAHDAAHGAMFKRKWVAEIVGTVFMLPALNVYRLWCLGHNRVHHGFTSFSPIDWIWRPLTLEEYAALSPLKTFLYHIERSLYGCGLHYLSKVWLSKMILFMPQNIKRHEANMIRLDKFFVLIFALGLGAFAYWLGGIVDVLMMLVLPFIVFNYVISLIVYLHHTHPEVSFFDEKQEWSHAIGALECTTMVRSHWLVDLLTHDIMVHTPHHVDIRIPFYRLRLAYAGILSVASYMIIIGMSGMGSEKKKNK